MPSPSQPSPKSRQRSSTLLPRMDVTPTPRSQTERESAVPSPATASTQQQSQTQQHTYRFPQRPRHPFEHPGANSSPSSQQANVAPPPPPPPKPFASSTRGYSPASSTGDSSSGRTPLTPADGSDYGYGDSRSMISAVAGARKVHKRGASVCFEDDPPKSEKGRLTKTGDSDEERRKERRRTEAKAAIELGKVVNGQISLNLDDDDDLPLNSMGSRLSAANPMLSFTPASPMSWAPSPSVPMMGPQQFIAPPSDPRFFAAHQHAMMVAKQAYQMAVAQQALAAANDEWERGSTTSAFTSVPMGMNSMQMGMGMGAQMSGMGMGGMMPGGYGMNYPMFAPSAQSMYAGSVVGSELGVGWGSKSEYGGPSRVSRTSAMFSDRQSAYGLSQNQRSSSYNQLAVSGSGTPDKRPAMRPRTKTAPSDGPLPPQHARARPAPPPSSWRPS